jgi:hypothetical protein
MVAVAILTLTTNLFIIGHIILMLVVFAIFIGPAVMLFQWLTRDHDFYGYYSRRHQSLAEVVAIGIPPVPKGDTHLERLDILLRSNPSMEALLEASDGDVEEGVGPRRYKFDRFYHGSILGQPTGVLVKAFDKMPDSKDLDTLLDEATVFAEKKIIFISRAVALVTADVEDIDDEVYDHLIAQGRKTKTTGCALQLVMEVEGLYSLVPYVAM